MTATAIALPRRKPTDAIGDGSGKRTSGGRVYLTAIGHPHQQTQRPPLLTLSRRCVKLKRRLQRNPDVSCCESIVPRRYEELV